MAPKHGGARATLSQGLDKEVSSYFYMCTIIFTVTFCLTFCQVYQIVRKFTDEQAQYDDSKRTRLSIVTVYERIKRSNSSLNRKSKKLLEDSIERVLGVMREEEPSSDDLGSIDGEFDGIEITESKVGLPSK